MSKASLDPNLHDIYQRSIFSAPSRVVLGIWITAELESVKCLKPVAQVSDKSIFVHFLMQIVQFKTFYFYMQWLEFITSLLREILFNV